MSPRPDSGIHSVFDFNATYIAESDLCHSDDILNEQVGSEHSMQLQHFKHNHLNGDLKHDLDEGHEMRVFNIGEAPGESQDDGTTVPGRLPPMDHPKVPEQLPPIRGGNLENGWTNSAYASENNNKGGRPGDNQSTTTHSQSATHPNNHPSNQVSDPQNVLQKKPMTPTDVDSPIKEEETPSTASEENKEPEEEVGNHFRYSLVFTSAQKNVMFFRTQNS